MYSGLGLVWSGPRENLHSVLPSLCKDKSELSYTPYPECLFWLCFLAQTNLFNPRYAIGRADISPPPVNPGPISLFSVFGIERRKSEISPVPFMSFGQLGLQRAFLPLLTPEYHVKWFFHSPGQKSRIIMGSLLKISSLNWAKKRYPQWVALLSTRPGSMRKGGTGSAMSVAVAEVPKTLDLKLGFASFLGEQAVFPLQIWSPSPDTWRKFITTFKDISCIAHEKVNWQTKRENILVWNFQLKQNCT